MAYNNSSNLFKVYIFALFFVGCESASKTSGTSKKVADISKQSTGTSEEDSTESSNASTGKKIKKKSTSKEGVDPVTGNAVSSTEPPTQMMPNLPKSKLTWDGSSLIGTPQLFLIPIE